MGKTSLSVSNLQPTPDNNHVSATFDVQIQTDHGRVCIHGFQLVARAKNEALIVQPDAASVAISPELLAHVRRRASEMYRLWLISPAQRLGGQEL